jgi:hypothetical protein
MGPGGSEVNSKRAYASSIWQNITSEWWIKEEQMTVYCVTKRRGSNEGLMRSRGTSVLDLRCRSEDDVVVDRAANWALVGGS